MSFLVFLAFIIVAASITVGFMASLVHAPRVSSLVRQGYAGRRRLSGGS